MLDEVVQQVKLEGQLRWNHAVLELHVGVQEAEKVVEPLGTSHLLLRSAGQTRQLKGLGWQLQLLQ